MKDRDIAVGISVIVASFFFYRFGISGLRTIISLELLYILPAYLILMRLNMEVLERLVYSFFIGIGIVPTLVFYIAMITGIRAAVAITFILLLSAGLIMAGLKGKGLGK